MKKTHTKSGAASFYVVAFSTLLLSIIVVSFATIVISEVSRTANSDLAQSAYDSAMAGIEDAKIALSNYKKCRGMVTSSPTALSPGDAVTCEDVVYFMEHPDCDTVGHILGRIRKNEKKEVLIEEATSSGKDGSNKMSQAYTCVKIKSVTDDYRGTLTSAEPVRVFRVRLHNAKANQVKSVRLSWYSDRNAQDNRPNSYHYAHYPASKSFVFPPITSGPAPTPPTIGLQLFQTSGNFTLSQLDYTSGSQTDRGTLFFSATNDKNASATNPSDQKYRPAAIPSIGYDNAIKEVGFLKSNDKTSENLPYLAYCPGNSGQEFACSVSMDIPAPKGGNRNDNTFIFAISLPYLKPDTDFALEFCSRDHDGYSCTKKPFDAGGSVEGKLQLDNAQISIDSTGRANDLFRRIETRIENVDIHFPHTQYAIQALGKGSDRITKHFYTISEHNFNNIP